MTQSRWWLRWLGPAVVLVAAAVMLVWSWGAWPDPLVDFGAQLYFPWRIHSGAVLYRDLAFYNGPLSQYVNALWFAIGGASLRTLVIANLAICFVTIALIYHLTLKSSGPIAAAAAGVTFAVFFAFGQGVGVGNYNWVTPYTHEIPHGVALGLLAIACLHQFHCTGKRIWLTIAGAVLGLTFLTKAEPFTAAAVAVIVQLVAHSRVRTGDAAKRSSPLPLFAIAAIIPVLVALLLLWLAMPLRDAAHAVAGSWPWVFDRRVATLPFYRAIAGVDDIGGNLWTMLEWTVAYAAILVPAAIVATRVHRHSWQWMAIAIVLLILGGILKANFWQTNWSSMLRPLPVCLTLALAVTARLIVRRQNQPATTADAARAALRMALVTFSIVLLAKIALNATVWRYGFALAMPGALVLVAAVAGDLPNWISRRGGSGNVLRAAGLAAWIAAATATIYWDDHWFSDKAWTVGAGADAFRADERGLEVQRMIQLIDQPVPKDGTIAVFPQGLMLNFLTRRPAPIKHVNFMPPEVLAAGETEIVALLAAHPPDAIVLNASTIEAGQFAMDANYHYGGETLTWILRNYTPVTTSELPPPLRTHYKLVLMKRK